MCCRKLARCRSSPAVTASGTWNFRWKRSLAGGSGLAGLGFLRWIVFSSICVREGFRKTHFET
ncbi:hypothetical protein JYU34_006171 [Plutella xylostella]|uniref:Uncharacterized protein n=1 Tax=Plutella xylostella TaxID=51655 RepID=A0ABQ7QV68_PLUXY|nr:hypothetical protein JYU34_006171 [Plutella xylostella]